MFDSQRPSVSRTARELSFVSRLVGNLLQRKSLVALLLVVSVFAQLSEAQIQLGKLSFSKANAPSLRNPTRLAAGLRSH